MKMGVIGLMALVLLCDVPLSQSRTMGHYAPGEVSIRDLAVPPAIARCPR